MPAVYLLGAGAAAGKAGHSGAEESQRERGTVEGVGFLPTMLAVDVEPAELDLILHELVDLWRQELLDRRELLRTLGVTSVVAGLDGLEGVLRLLAPRLSSVTDSGDLKLAGSLMRRLERTYYFGQPAALLLPLRALIGRLEAMAVSQRGHDRTGALRLLGRANLLAGRISFFDLHRDLDARAFFAVAAEAGTESQDRVLAATAWGHTAFLPAAKEHFPAARRHLDHALHLVSPAGPPAVFAWLWAVASEVEAKAHHGDAALAAIDRAAGHAGTRTGLPEWFDFFDEARLSGFEGFAARTAGRHEQAILALRRSLDPAAALGPKQRAVVTLDLAVVHAERGDVQAACDLACDAVADLHTVGSATARDRLSELRRAIPAPRDPAARLLDDRIRELG